MCDKFELLELIENVKEKLTDNEYKLMIEKLAITRLETYKIMITKHEVKNCVTWGDNDDYETNNFVITSNIIKSSLVFDSDLRCLNNYESADKECNENQLCFSCKLKRDKYIYTDTYLHYPFFKDFGTSHPFYKFTDTPGEISILDYPSHFKDDDDNSKFLNIEVYISSDGIKNYTFQIV